MPMSSKGTKIYLSDAVIKSAISAVSKAAPAVVTVASHGAAVGDMVGIQGTGFDTIDNQLWEVEAQTATTVTLRSSDTTAETGPGTSGTLIAGGPLVEICFATLTRDSPAASTLDVTTLCDEERQQMSGMKNNGTWTAQGFYESDSPGQDQLREAYDDGEQRLMMIEPPDKSKILYYTQVNQLSENFAVDQPVQVNTGGIVMGKVTYIKPAAAGAMAAPAAPAPAKAA